MCPGRPRFCHRGAALVCAQGENATFRTKGVPATPRDGAAIEITCLCYSALQWMLRVASTHPELLVLDALVAPGRTSYTHAEWAAALRQNFERLYYIPLLESEDDGHDIVRSLINRCGWGCGGQGVRVPVRLLLMCRFRRGIYKDTHRASSPWTDYQLRPNMVIGMALAPTLFNPEHAARALGIADTVVSSSARGGVRGDVRVTLATCGCARS